MIKVNSLNNTSFKTSLIGKLNKTKEASHYLQNTRSVQQDSFVKSCEYSFHFDDSMSCVFGEFPKDYVNTEKIFIGARPESFSKMLKKIIPAKPAHWETIQTIKPSYYISHIFSHQKGQGTKVIKSIVEKSLNDVRTNGRVTLQADIIDGKSSPAGFYYKLGFRFANNEQNTILQKWLNEGGKKEAAPMLTGFMYLPKENIKHCLNY